MMGKASAENMKTKQPGGDKRYRDMVENLQEGIWELDENFNTVFVNPRMAEMMGYPIGEMIGKNAYSFIAAPNQKRARRYLKRQMQGIREQFDFEFVKKDGTPLYARMEAGPVYDRNNNIRGVFASFMDISRRKKAEEELVKSRRNFSIAFQTNPAPTVISTLEEGRYIDVNKSFLDLIGYERKEMIGRTAHELKVWDRDGQRTELVARLKKGGSLRNELILLRTKDGQLKHINWSAEVIEVDGKAALLSLFYDITAQRKNEEVLKEFSAYTRSLIEASIDPLISVSPERRITDVNRATEQFLGVGRESLVGSDFARCFTHPEKAGTMLNDVLYSGFVKNFPLQMRHKSGRASDVLINASVYRDGSGKVQGVLAAARDIEDQKRAMKTLQKRDRELSIKSKNLQELNSALRVLIKHREYDKKELESKVLMNVKKLVLPYLEKLKTISFDPEQKAYLDIMDTHLQDIISPFLHTLTSNHLGLTPREIQVVTMIREDKSTKEIAAAMNISTRAVEFHRNSIRRKFQLAGKKVNLKSYLTRLA
jgi:PAS domain S-box-containing protein